MEIVESFGWTREGKVKVGRNAELQVPSGTQFTDPSGAKKLIQYTGNIPDPSTLGILSSPDLSWWADFSFNDEGYVKDDEKDDIDADALLKTMREGQDQANAQREKQGLAPLIITGWAVKPFYNVESKALEYGLKIVRKGREDSEGSVNYSTKILGRRGYMDVTLICSPAILNESLASLRGALTGFNYTSGETYAEYKEGDKVSQYGLTALIAGGTLAVAAKTGLLAKLWKPILAGLLVLAAGAKSLWQKLTGRGNS